MKLTKVLINNIRSVSRSGELDLGPVTIFVGKNNSGKSTILHAIYDMQTGGALQPKDVRYGTDVGTVELAFTDVNTPKFWSVNASFSDAILNTHVYKNGQNSSRSLRGGDGSNFGVGEIPGSAPNNFVFPFLAGRKVVAYDETINRAQALTVSTNLSNLAARVDLLMDRQHPQHETFMELVDEVIGLKLSAIASNNGKRVGMWVSNTEAIYIDDMGAGIAQLLGFIVNLCLAEGQLFLIEELENDVHPEALKLLLTVMARARQDNQFIISTHNNVVVRTLGSLPDTKIYRVTSEFAEQGGFRLPSTTVRLVGNNVSERTAILQDLGYELSDLDLWDGWLLLEESSAERIIRDHLIRWFAPGLSRVRPVAANGTSDVERTFDSLYKLSLFTHLESRYRGRVRVITDGDPSGVEVISKLRAKFRDWPEDSFQTFEQHDFERYYPARFQIKVDAALPLSKREKKNAKRDLLVEVLEWIEGNEQTARQEFQESAAEVIEKLRSLETALGPAAEHA